jgi:hypothetical protein
MNNNERLVEILHRAINNGYFVFSASGGNGGGGFDLFGHRCYDETEDHFLSDLELSFEMVSKADEVKQISKEELLPDFDDKEIDFDRAEIWQVTYDKRYQNPIFEQFIVYPDLY